MNWMHSCRQAAELLSQRLDEPLGLLDTIRLRVHLSMCGDDHAAQTSPPVGKCQSGGPDVEQ